MDNDQNPELAQNVPVGKQLQRAREKAGLSVNEVAEVQHLRCGVIQAIENCEYSKIDTELFLKGYVRAYAKQLGLNGDELISDLELELQPLRQKREQELEANPLVSIERRRRHKRRVGKLFLLLAAVVLIGFLVFTFGVGHYAGVSTQSSIASGAADQAETVPGTSDLAEPSAEVPAAPEAGFPDNTEAAVVESELQAEPESAAPVVVESVEAALAEPGEPMVASSTGILQITFVGDCWVQVRDATGDKLVNSLQREGDRIDISGETPLKVVIGAVDAVGSIRFQGEALNLRDYSVINNRSEFTLTI